MKVFISADIEGVTGINTWSETTLGNFDYVRFQKQMTKEVAAACQGALKAGATEIYVRDAHDSARNIIGEELPQGVKLIRNWNGHPHQMMFGLTEEFDAAILIGYHSAGGYGWNPLSHTMNTSRVLEVLLNGERLSEFAISAMTAKYIGVSLVFVSGDVGLGEDVRRLDPGIVFHGTNEGIGQTTISKHPLDSLRDIEIGVEKAIAQKDEHDFELPEFYELKVKYKSHTEAYRNSFFPGVTTEGESTLVFETDDFFEFLRAVKYII
ncbi:MAG: M55 family metallopeptidase [Clostridiaceae bacterium]